MGAIRSLILGADGKVYAARILFLIWSTLVFVCWFLLSLENKTIEDIPPTLVTTLGLLLGGEGARDYLLKEITRNNVAFDQKSLTRTLLFLGSLAVLILWVVESQSASKLADIPETVVTVLGLLAGGESTRAYLHLKTGRATQS